MRLRKPRIAFYKYTKKPLNFAIALWTWLPNINTPPYSHCEVGFFIKGEWWYFTSTLRNNAQGCRWIREKDMLKHPERWDIYEIINPCSTQKEMIDSANNIIGDKYDMPGIFGFFIPGMNDKSKWYCSEACWLVIALYWIKKISPRYLYRKVKKLCGLKLLNT